MSKSSSVKVNIPAGVDSGMILRVQNHGNEALNGKAGDLILKIIVRKSPKFTRKGFEIHTEKKITVTQAILGDTCQIETIRGQQKIKIPPGTKDGSTMKLEKQGLPIIQEYQKSEKSIGDHVVTFKIEVPSASQLSFEQKKALKNFEKEMEKAF